MLAFHSTRIVHILFIIGVFVPTSMILADDISLPASKDNTIFSEGDLSNGSGDHLFSGTNGIGNFRRALLKFDVAASLPVGATIDSVQLSLNVSKVPDVFPQNFSLFLLTSDWGESSSNAPDEEGTGTDAATDDASWIHTFFPFKFWTTAGGDIVANASATALIGGLGSVIWRSTDAMVADVQQWLDQPDSNFGWLLIGDETAAGTARRFDSRENPQASQTPRLQITFTPLPPTGACCSRSGDCSDVQASVCRLSGGFFKSAGSSCALIQECPLFADSFEN